MARLGGDAGDTVTVGAAIGVIDDAAIEARGAPAVTFALELSATLEDLLVTIDPHPTLSEAIMEGAEVTAGTPVPVLARGGM